MTTWWNKKNEAKKVKVGDRIIQIDIGLRGNSALLLMQLQQKHKLKVFIERDSEYVKPNVT